MHNDFLYMHTGSSVGADKPLGGGPLSPDQLPASVKYNLIGPAW